MQIPVKSTFLIIVLSLFGCISSRNLPRSQVVSIPEKKKVYYLHSEQNVWIVFPITGENGMFTATIVEPENVTNNILRQIHIYASPATAIKIDKQILTCPMDNIVKVENYKINPFMVIGAAGVLGLLFLVPVFL